MNEPEISTPVEAAPPTPAPRKRSRRRLFILLMLGFAIAGAGFVASMKMKAKEEYKHIEKKREIDAKTRAATTAAQRESILTRHGGESTNTTQQALVNRVGNAILSGIETKNGQKLPVRYHLLAEPNILNLFSFSSTEGSDIYITTALLNRMRTEGELAALLAHGAAHAQAQDMMEEAEGTPLHYDVAEETKNDANSMKLMATAGYNPKAMIGMFLILLEAHQQGAEVEYFITHPNDPNRLEKIQQWIDTTYPNGVPKEFSE